jgi:hypothetical protein
VKSIRTIAALAICMLAAACGDVPTQPARAAAPAAPLADETNQGLTISCPYHTIDINEVIYCTTTYFGTNVTASTNFYAMNTSVVQTGANGYVKGLASGGTLVWGSYNGITVSWDTQVTDIGVTVTPSKWDASNEYVTWTATPSVAGSYYYQWQAKWCYNGTAPGDCDGLWHASTSGQDLTTRTAYVHDRDRYVAFRAILRRSSTGTILDSDEAMVWGGDVGCTMC